MHTILRLTAISLRLGKPLQSCAAIYASIIQLKNFEQRGSFLYGIPGALRPTIDRISTCVPLFSVDAVPHETTHRVSYCDSWT